MKIILDKIIKKLMTREVITYFIAGILTTLVNIVVYHIFCNILGVENLLANGIAFVISVIFAYVVNDRFVFEQEKMPWKKNLIKVIKFMTARLFSFGVDEIGMFLLVEFLFVNNMVSKVVMNIIVIIINYVLSKLFIFKNKTQKI